VQPRSSTTVVYCALLFATVSAVAPAQSPSAKPYPSRVLGVFDEATGEPIEGAKVIDVASGTFALTTSTGTVSLVFLPAGGGSVIVRKIGYAVSRAIEVAAGDTMPITVVLRATQTVLPAMITTDSSPHYVSPGLREFEERRTGKGSLGHFISEAELRKNDNREMPDVLRQIPGMTIKCSTRTPRRCTANTFRCGALGFAIYVDGTRVTDSNLLMLNVAEFAGVEAYTGATVPVQYNMTSQTCGVLLFWTRER
jgi:hypothetical protein